MELAAYLGTVTAVTTLALGAMWVVASVLGRRIDDVGAALGARIDDMGAALGARIDDMGAALGARIDDMGSSLGARSSGLAARMDRLEGQNDAIIGAVGDLAQRVAQLEARNT